MHEDYLETIRTIFNTHPEFILEEISGEASLISVTFTYQGRPLILYVFDPGNEYLRSVMVCLEDNIADELKIPAHYIRYSNKQKRSALCLLDQEQHVLSSYSLAELVDLYLGQTKSLLSLSPKQKENEFLKEFEYYWESASRKSGNSHNYAEIYLPESGAARLLNSWYSKDNSIGKYVIFPEEITFNSCNTPEGTKSSAIYIPIDFPNGIIPPQSNIPWSARDLLDIVCNQTKDRISAESFDFLNELQINNYNKTVVFSFSQPNSVAITVAGVLSFNNNKRKSFISKIQEDFQSFVPIKSNRMDMKYLHERVGQHHMELPAILLVGCGSVGSYILPELVNLGFTDIGISDPEKFVSGNSLRHYLGPRSNNRNKTSQLGFFMEYENPLVSVCTVSNLLDLDDNALTDTLSKYDIVIVAVGGTDLQRKFNYRFSKTSSTAWFIYNWLDAEGKGAHALAMRYTHKGCYNCLFYDDGLPTARNKVSYADGTERVIGNGCGGSFSPYGNNVLVRNTSLVLSVLQGVLSGSITRNTVASLRNDFSTLESSIAMVPVIDSDFAEERCDICGHI